MAINVIDRIKPISDFPVSEAIDIDVDGKRRLKSVLDKIQDDIKAIDKNIELITDDDINSLT